MTHIAVTVCTSLAAVDLKQMWFNGKVGKLTWMILESQPSSYRWVFLVYNWSHLLQSH